MEDKDKKDKTPVRSEETQRRYNKRRVSRGKAPELLRQWASSKEISFSVLADTLGISRACLTLYAQGAVTPSMENAAKLYKATEGMVDFVDWFDADELEAFSGYEYETRTRGRPKSTSAKPSEATIVQRKRKKQRKEYFKNMAKKTPKESTDKQRKLEAQARLLLVGQMDTGFTEV